MSRPTFPQRLGRVLKQGNLTVADLARWFEKPHATVRGWVRGGNLGLPPLDAAYVEAQLGLLEQRLKKRRGLPVPRMSARARTTYMKDLRASL